MTYDSAVAEQGFLDRMSRRLARLNRWLSGAAVAASTEAHSAAPGVNPAAMATVAGEAESEVEGADTAEREAPDDAEPPAST